MDKVIYRFDEVLTDGHGCLLLGDAYALREFQNKNKLGENLQIAFTTTQAGDDVVKHGDMIYLGNVQNPYDNGYTILFNFSNRSHVESLQNSKILHKINGYILHITSNALCVYSWRYLQKFNDDMIDRLYRLSEPNQIDRAENENGTTFITDNPVRQRISIPNGYYQVDVIGGYFEDDKPVFEFMITPTSQTHIEDDVSHLTSYSFELGNL